MATLSRPETSGLGSKTVRQTSVGEAVISLTVQHVGHVVRIVPMGCGI